MDALILTCGTGGGHNAAAYAMEEELNNRGHHTVVLNPYTLKSDRLASIIDHCYIRIAQKLPKLFGLIYRAGMLYNKLPVRSPVYHVNKTMMERMKTYLSQHHFDVIVMTHLFPAEILTNLKDHGTPIPPCLFIATDYTCIPFCGEIDCDFYVIPSKDLTREFSSQGIAPHTIYPLGIPTRSAFHRNMDKIQIKKGLKLSLEKNYIFISGGSMGAGKLIHAIRKVLSHYANDSSIEIIVLCGNNISLYRKLKRLYKNRVIPLKHTEHVAEYMVACEAVITKPGGLTSTEAAVCNSRLIHISPIPGCETKNAHFFSKNGLSIFVPSMKELIPAIEHLQKDAAYQRMKNQQNRYINKFAASDICELIERHINEDIT